MNILPLPPSSWICDSCGQTIKSVSEGWVEWLTFQDGDTWQGRGLRLVHDCTAFDPVDTRCQYDQQKEFQRDGSILGDMPLKTFVGTDGLITLLSFVAKGELPKGEVLEMIKRLHVPGYEQARFHFKEAIAEGVFEPNTMPGYYSVGDINSVLNYVRHSRSDQ